MSGFQPPHQSGPPGPGDQPPDPNQPHPYQPHPYQPPYPNPGHPLPSSGPVPLDQPYYGAGFLEAVKRFWRKYVIFSGRASRSEFWWWKLANLVVGIVLGVITSVITTATALSGAGDPIANMTQLTRAGSPSAQIPAHLWALAVLLPTIAVTVRRLHDTGRTGWWYLLAVPGLLFGWVSLVVPVSDYLPVYTAPGGLPTLPGAFWTLLAGALIAGAGALVVLLLCISAPKPEGARFDRR